MGMGHNLAKRVFPRQFSNCRRLERRTRLSTEPWQCGSEMWQPLEGGNGKNKVAPACLIRVATTDRRSNRLALSLPFAHCAPFQTATTSGSTRRWQGPKSA